MKPVKNTIDIEREERDQNLRNNIQPYLRNTYPRMSIDSVEYGSSFRNNSSYCLYPYQSTVADCNTYGQRTIGGRIW